MKNEKAAKEKAEQRLIMIAPLLDPGLDKEGLEIEQKKAIKPGYRKYLY